MLVRKTPPPSNTANFFQPKIYFILCTRFVRFDIAYIKCLSDVILMDHNIFFLTFCPSLSSFNEV